MLLNPKWGIGKAFDLIMQRRELEKLVKFCTVQLSLENYPPIETLKMQKYFSYQVERLDEISEANRSNLKTLLVKLEHEIVGIDCVEDDDDMSTLFKKIVYYITLLSGLGNPQIIEVFVMFAEAFLCSILVYCRSIRKLAELYIVFLIKSI